METFKAGTKVKYIGSREKYYQRIGIVIDEWRTISHLYVMVKFARDNDYDYQSFLSRDLEICPLTPEEIEQQKRTTFAMSLL